MVPSIDAEAARVVVFLVADIRLLVPRTVVFFAVVRVAVFFERVAASVPFFVAAVVADSVAAAFFLITVEERRGVLGSAAVSPVVSAVVFLRAVRCVFSFPFC